ncbi:MAG: Nucleotidyl transferase family protein [Candidatus Eremiobacteraeota bacterium]|nr:Nucleotidyl transferase family protein [Candidatus Eremiobacteraeota bacterium]
MLPVAILCGGKGTRIAALAGDLPKALVPVAGEPFLAHQLRWLRDAGATNVVLLTGYRGDRIRAFAGDGAAFGLRIAYSDDGAAARGTAGAIVRAIPLLGEAFITVYGDALLGADPARVEDALRAPYDGVMTVYRNEDRRQASNVRTDGERVTAYDKHAPSGTMTHIDYGINAFHAADFARVAAADAPADLAVVHRELIERGTLRALEVAERWYEIGSPAGLAETERYLREAKGTAS